MILLIAENFSGEDEEVEVEEMEEMEKEKNLGMWTNLFSACRSEIQAALTHRSFY